MHRVRGLILGAHVPYLQHVPAEANEQSHQIPVAGVLAAAAAPAGSVS